MCSIINKFITQAVKPPKSGWHVPWHQDGERCRCVSASLLVLLFYFLVFSADDGFLINVFMCVSIYVYANAIRALISGASC